jgi:adenine-specific DNA methylase/REP element-mobilizing transposase RayT
MSDVPRLIEHAFPLKQASLDSVHEKNVRHGHISTLHIWPARRPLAACRAALIATLLPDPGTPEKRKELCEKIGGKVVKKIERKKMPNGQVVEREKEVTEGGILHWGRETENKEILEWFRQEIKKAYGGRAPKVLDPFAGGGAIPLEAMRLGCEATAIDINPVAWFILKCTLEYPQKLAGKTWPLPAFILKNEAFMEAFYKAHPHLVGRTKWTKKQKEAFSSDLFLKDKTESERVPKADLAWHVRAWGKWVLDRARKELAKYYPVYAEFEPVDVTSRRVILSGGTPLLPYEKQPIRLVPLKDDGTADVDALNKDFSKEYLAIKGNPRWVAKPTVAYLWARTVKCKNCRATIPLLKTRWLCKKEKKRILLTVDATSPSPSRIKSSGETPLLQYFDPNEPIANLSGNLPHWRQEGVTYFVTFRLADSMPQEKLREWEEERGAWLKEHPEPHDEETRKEYYRLFPERFQNWLDAGYGECLLARPEIKEMVENALSHFEGKRYHLDEYVIMPNHVHVIVTPSEENNLSEILHSWKSYTAHEINKRLEHRGAVWQKESFDHIIRSPQQVERVRQYIRENPKSRRGVPPLDRVEAASGRFGEKRRDDASTLTRRDVASTIIFNIEKNVPTKGANTAQRREHDKRVGAGTMSRSGAKCPCCDAIMTMEDIRLESVAGHGGYQLTAIVIEGRESKEYRSPSVHEISTFDNAKGHLEEALRNLPNASVTAPFSPCSTRSISAQLYGVRQWIDLYTPRQALAIAQFGKAILEAHSSMGQVGYKSNWISAVSDYLCLGLDRLMCFLCVNARWKSDADSLTDAFSRFSISLLWDFAEAQPLGTSAGSYIRCNERIATALDGLIAGIDEEEPPHIVMASAMKPLAPSKMDVIITDPPYYEAVSYADLSDFSYTWLRGFRPELTKEFEGRLTNKTNEAVQHIHENKDREAERLKYENQMAESFIRARESLTDEGRFVCVFAHKDPSAWETLVFAIIRAGFVVTGSWPIQTEMPSRQRASSAASLASSVWLVCKTRDFSARPGWDNQVLDEMRRNIREKLREFWDAGIRGPDFVWAATGPALEAYSKHPVVKKANDPGQVMTVSEFLTHVRRIVVDFVVGRVLSGSDVSSLQESGGDAASTMLDEPTAYYLLHRHDFGLDEAPAGACILYAISCGISDRELAATWDLITFTKGRSDVPSLEESDAHENYESGEDAASTLEEESGSQVKLKTWVQRKNRSLGYEAPGGKPIPLIDRIHCLMHLWKGGDVHKVDEYLDENGLRRQELFKRLLQSLIELSPHGSEERSLLESLSNYVQARGAVQESPLAKLPLEGKEP